MLVGAQGGSIDKSRVRWRNSVVPSPCMSYVDILYMVCPGIYAGNALLNPAGGMKK